MKDEVWPTWEETSYSHVKPGIVIAGYAATSCPTLPGMASCEDAQLSPALHSRAVARSGRGAPLVKRGGSPPDPLCALRDLHARHASDPASVASAHASKQHPLRSVARTAHGSLRVRTAVVSQSATLRSGSGSQASLPHNMCTVHHWVSSPTPLPPRDVTDFATSRVASF